MPHRFPCAKLVCSLRRRGTGTLPRGNGSGGQASCPAGPQPCPAPGPAVRHIGPGSRLYQRIRSGGTGERRTVYPSGGPDRDGLCRTRRRRPGVGASGDDQSDKSCEITRRDRGVQRRALRRRCGRLCGPSAHRVGGWTWYTGSAGWMYRLIVESLLGLRWEADKVHRAVPA
jgi:hypothetical protein